MLSDAGMIVEIATKVLGWTVRPPRSIGPGTENMIEFKRPKACNVFWWPGSREWDPLTSDSDAFMVVDAMKTKGWSYRVSECDGGGGEHMTAARFWNRFGATGGFLVEDLDRRRAICLAALAALGGTRDE